MRVHSELTQMLAHVLELLQLCTSVTERRNLQLHTRLSSSTTHFLQKSRRSPVTACRRKPLCMGAALWLLSLLQQPLVRPRFPGLSPQPRSGFVRRA